MNDYNGIGRLTRDPELKYTANNKAVCSWKIAINRSKDKTDFIPCVAWEQTAELVNKYFKKGRMIGVSGELNSKQYEQDGKKRTDLEVTVKKITFCDSNTDIPIQSSAPPNTQSAYDGSERADEAAEEIDERLPY